MLAAGGTRIWLASESEGGQQEDEGTRHRSVTASGWSFQRTPRSHRRIAGVGLSRSISIREGPIDGWMGRWLGNSTLSALFHWSVCLLRRRRSAVGLRVVGFLAFASGLRQVRQSGSACRLDEAEKAKRPARARARDRSNHFPVALLCGRQPCGQCLPTRTDTIAVLIIR